MSEARKLQLMNLSLFLVAFTIPTLFVVNSVAIIIMVAAWLIQGKFRPTLANLKSNKMLLVWMALFVLHALSYFYSDNKGDSAFDLQTKLSFFVMPIVVGAGITISRKTLEIIFIGFVSGVTAAALFCIIQAIYLYNLDHESGHFFYHSLVAGMDTNAVYVAWYVIFSLTVLFIFDWQYLFKGGSRYIRYLLILIQSVFFILLSSKMLLVLFFVVLAPLFYRRHYKTRKQGVLPRVLLLLGGIAIVCCVMFTNNPIKQRFSDVFAKEHAARADNNNANINPIEAKLNNLTLRIFVWKAGLSAIAADNLWLTGCGNGDAHTVINDALYKKGITNIYDKKDRSALYNVNMHNMYLQILLMLGVAGLAVFVVIMGAPLFVLKHLGAERTLFFLFQLAGILFMAQEAALQTHGGIIYFTFFSQILWNIYHVNQSNSVNS